MKNLSSLFANSKPPDRLWRRPSGGMTTFNRITGPQILGYFQKVMVMVDTSKMLSVKACHKITEYCFSLLQLLPEKFQTFS